MAAIIGLLVILVISMTMVRVGAVALELTGLSYEVAAFQAQSAFSGAGFTTAESESIVTHPVRRRIIRMLILVGNVGIVSTGATLIVALTGFSSENIGFRGPLLAGALVGFYLLSRSKALHELMKKVIMNALNNSTTLQLTDYHDVLGISKGYSVSRMRVKSGNWQVGKALKDLHLQKEGTTVLAVNRSIGGSESTLQPHGELVVEVDDLMTVYGRDEAIHCLFNRKCGEEGDKAHEIRSNQREAITQLAAGEEAPA
jgi:hypothetical protein